MKDIKEKIVDMALNGSGIRNTSRVLQVSKNTVIDTIKKETSMVTVNPNFQTTPSNPKPTVRLERVCHEAELNEQWSFVGKKANPRWL